MCAVLVEGILKKFSMIFSTWTNGSGEDAV